MKKTIIVVLLLLISCTNNIKEEERIYENHAVSGLIIDEFNNQPVSFMNVGYTLCIEPDDSVLLRCVESDTGSVESIKEGSFGIFLRFKSIMDELSYYPMTSINNMNYVPIYETKRYKTTIKELKNIDRLTIKVAKLKQFIVNVKNISPFDEQDRIEIKKFVFDDPEISPKMEYFNIENRRGANEQKNVGNNQYIDLLAWNGKNIDSTVDGMIISNRYVYVEYEVTKNGKTRILRTQPKLIKRDRYNYLTIEY